MFVGSPNKHIEDDRVCSSALFTLRRMTRSGIGDFNMTLICKLKKMKKQAKLGKLINKKLDPEEQQTEGIPVLNKIKGETMSYYYLK